MHLWMPWLWDCTSAYINYVSIDFKGMHLRMLNVSFDKLYQFVTRGNQNENLVWIKKLIRRILSVVFLLFFIFIIIIFFSFFFFLLWFCLAEFRLFGLQIGFPLANCVQFLCVFQKPKRKSDSFWSWIFFGIERFGMSFEFCFGIEIKFCFGNFLELKDLEWVFLIQFRNPKIWPSLNWCVLIGGENLGHWFWNLFKQSQIGLSEALMKKMMHDWNWCTTGIDTQLELLMHKLNWCTTGIDTQLQLMYNWNWYKTGIDAQLELIHNWKLYTTGNDTQLEMMIDAQLELMNNWNWNEQLA